MFTVDVKQQHNNNNSSKKVCCKRMFLKKKLLSISQFDQLFLSVCIFWRLCILRKLPAQSDNIQWNFSGSNTDGSFSMAVSNSFLRP